MTPEINHDTELVQILIYLADAKEMTRQSLSNTVYCSAIDKWFASYKNHSAVTSTRELIINRHFNYSRPHKAALRLYDIVDDEADDLHEWAVEVKRFIYDSRFDLFWSSQKDYHDWILKTINDCDFDAWMKYIENYFRSQPDEFRLIICPLDGNYGFNLTSCGGKNISYIIRCMPYFKDGLPTWQFDFFAKGIAHEYAHCFVNPAVEAHKDILQKHSLFFNSHKNMPDFYNTDYAVINEYFVRAFAVRFMEKHNFEDFDINAEYERQRENFVYFDLFVDELKKYENQSNTFLEYYTANINRILLEVENYINNSKLCFCGHDCSRCLTYLATVNNDEELHLKSQRFYKDEFNIDVPLEKLHCLGGQSADVLYLCKDCPWMKCAKEKGLSACSECVEYPCKPLSEYQEKYVNRCNQIKL